MILCLETATPVCSVALNEGCCTLALRETEGQNAHSEKITNFIREVMDPDHMQDIYDYFREAEDNNIDDALDEFADDEDEYTEEEIKLVRIKFLAENGN